MNCGYDISVVDDSQYQQVYDSEIEVGVGISRNNGDYLSESVKDCELDENKG